MFATGVKGRGVDEGEVRTVAGSMGSPNAQNHLMSGPVKPGKSLINPFDPSHVTIKLTSNRRRWSHIFPKGPTGLLIQQHHYQANPGPEQQTFCGSPLTGAFRTSRSTTQDSLHERALNFLLFLYKLESLHQLGEDKSVKLVKEANYCLTQDIR